jgi:hypothetical protein
MAKSKTPKQQTPKQVTEKDDDALYQSAPRRFRLFKQQQERIERNKKSEDFKIIKKKPKEPVKSTSEKLQEIQKKVNQSEFKNTKKYEKRQSFLNREKRKVSMEKNRELYNYEILQKKLVDKVKFGETVMEPPKITIKPKVKAQLPKKAQVPKEKIQYNNVRGVGLRQLGRKLKLKDMSIADRQSLLSERERAINLYRKNKPQPVSHP